MCEFDALLATDPATLGPDETRSLLHALAKARRAIDALELAALARFDSMGWHLDDAALTTKAWLAHETGESRAVAASRVRLAKRLRRLPLIADALAAGAVTASHARSMARCLTPRTLVALARDEAMLVAQARALEADDFDVAISYWLRVNDVDGPDPADGPASSLTADRHFRGRVRLEAELDVDDGAEFLAELEALHDELWHEDRTADEADPNRHRSRAERNAEALVEMARRSSATRAEDATDTPAESARRRRPRGHLIIAVTDVASLAGSPHGHAELEDGTLLPHSVLERWACDTAIGRVVMRGPSLPFDLGRVTYTPSDGQRRVLAARDKGCIVPGCKRKPRWCEPHHVQWWTHGGPTDMGNLILLCHRHHKIVHAGLIRFERTDQDHGWIVLRADGTRLTARPPPALAA